MASPDEQPGAFRSRGADDVEAVDRVDGERLRTAKRKASRRAASTRVRDDDAYDPPDEPPPGWARP